MVKIKIRKNGQVLEEYTSPVIPQIGDHVGIVFRLSNEKDVRGKVCNVWHRFEFGEFKYIDVHIE